MKTWDMFNAMQKTGGSEKTGRSTWNVELGWIKPVELQVETEANSFDRDQHNQVNN